MMIADCSEKRCAYTLFELVLVLAVIVVLMTLVYPSLDAMYGDYRLTQAADMVRASWATARAQALDEGRPYRFAVVQGKGNYRIAPDTADAWAGSGDTASAQDSADPGLMVEDALPKGVRFSSIDQVQSGNVEQDSDTFLPPGEVDPALWTSTATFLPDGTCRDDVEITFYSRGARPLSLRLRALTGVVTVKSYRPEEYRP